MTKIVSTRDIADIATLDAATVNSRHAADFAASIHTHVAGDIGAGTFQNTTPYSARVHTSAAITIATATLTAIIFTEQRFNNGPLWSAGAPTRLTIPAGGAGIYAIFGVLEFTANAVGTRNTLIRLNGTNYIGINSMYTITDAYRTVDAPVSCIWNMAVGDYVEFIARQYSGGNLDVAHGDSNSVEFMMGRIS